MNAGRVILLGLGDIGATNTPGEAVKTLALGSCIAVILLEPRTRTVGMAHIVLPEAKTNPELSKMKPGYFADTGIPVLLNEMARCGVSASGGQIMVKLVGGAKILDPHGTFNVGKRNELAVKKVLWQFGMGPCAEDLGGTLSRTVAVDVDNGRVVISSPARENWEL